MGTFVTSNTPLPPPKANKNPPLDPTHEIDAEDVNNLWAAVGDVRSALAVSIFFNVKSYGATGSGAAGTDDSAAIASASTALAAAGGHILFFPAGTYRVSLNTTTDPAVMLWFDSGAALSVDAGKTFTAGGRVISLGGDPKVGAGAIIYGKDGNLFANDFGFSFSKTPSTGTDDFFHIRRDIQGSTGIIIRNDDDVGNLTDSYIHLYGGPLTGGTQGSNLRFSAGNLANNGGLCNIVAQHCASFNLLNLDTTPVRMHTAGVLQFEVASVPSAVNYWQFKGGAAASSVSVTPAGTDTNISVTQNTKGTGSHFFRTGVTPAFQLEVKDTAGAARRVVVTGSVAGNPTISASAGSINLAAPAAVTGLSVFANNAAAIAGGLAVGNLYRTGADPDVVCVVH